MQHVYLCRMYTFAGATGMQDVHLCRMYMYAHHAGCTMLDVHACKMYVYAGCIHTCICRVTWITHVMSAAQRSWQLRGCASTKPATIVMHQHSCARFAERLTRIQVSCVTTPWSTKARDLTSVANVEWTLWRYSSLGMSVKSLFDCRQQIIIMDFMEVSSLWMSVKSLFDIRQQIIIIKISN